MFITSHRSFPLPEAPGVPLWRWLVRRPGPRTITLDVESLPDYLKRDLGLEGGRSAPPRDPFRD